MSSGKTIRCAGRCGLLIWSTNGLDRCGPCIGAEREARLAQQRAAANAIVLDSSGRVTFARALIIVGYGGRCMCCGTHEAHELELDHVHWSENDRDLDSKTLYRKLIRNGYPTGEHQLLCGRCNTSKGRGPKCTLSHPKVSKNVP